MKFSFRLASILVISLIFPFFFFSTFNGSSARIFQEIWSIGHFVFFGLVTYVLSTSEIFKLQSKRRRLIVVFIVLTACAAGVEGVQAFLPGRTPDMMDLYYGLAGGSVVLLGCQVYKVNLTKRIIPYSAVAGLFFVFLAPFWIVVYDTYCAYRSFPLLSGGELHWEMSRWSGLGEIKRVQNPVYSGRSAIQVRLLPGKYPGISLQHFPPDWDAAKFFQFSVFNPGDDFFIHYRLHDSKHEEGEQSYDDRFNGKQKLKRGWNIIKIPRGQIERAPATRLMELGAMQNFTIFLVDNVDEKLFYVDDVRLILDE